MTEVKSADKEEREGRCKAGRGEGEEEVGKYCTILPQKMLIRILAGSKIMMLKKTRK